MLRPDRKAFILTLPSKVITPPVTMSIGVQAWDNMRRRTRTLMHRTDEFEPADPPRTTPIYPEGSGAVSLVAKRLTAFQKDWDRRTEDKVKLFFYTSRGCTLSKPL